jgi:hypothetical protein
MERVKKERKEKRQVIRFKNSFFSVFLHGCHVPVVEVLCVSRLLFITGAFAALPTAAEQTRNGGLL